MHGLDRPTVRVRVTLIVDVSVSEWRASYGTDSRADIREYVTETAVDSVRETWRLRGLEATARSVREATR